MAVDKAMVLDTKQKLGRLINQKIDAYPSLQDAAIDASVSILLIGDIRKEAWEGISMTQLYFAAERFGIELCVAGSEEDE